jgi:hypothetical protein
MDENALLRPFNPFLTDEEQAKSTHIEIKRKDTNEEIKAILQKLIGELPQSHFSFLSYLLSCYVMDEQIDQIQQ